MRYISTRGGAPALEFDDVLLAGLAADGGLYLPESWPRLTVEELRGLAGLPYVETAIRIMTPFLGGRIPAEEFAGMVRDSYAGFDHRAVAPLKQIGPDRWLLELFHGPTLAFKDYALQLVGRLFDHVLQRSGGSITIVGATSGDTGSAAIDACRDRAGIDIFILHPRGRVSEVQRRQMTTVTSANVHNISIDGTFDDCQDLVKAMLNDAKLRAEMRLSAVNSINWARILAQVVYYATAAIAVGAPDRAVAFAIPSGNFGNAYAGYVARQMGLPIARLVVASNRNDILYRFIETGTMATATVEPSLSPSMDIQVSSNVERLLFDYLYGRDGARTAAAMTNFRGDRRLVLDEAERRKLRRLFDGHREDDEGTRRAIADTFRETGEIIDPHTAVGVAAARAWRGPPGVPVIALATAHPAKFPQAVEAAIGRAPPVPARLADIMKRPERCAVLPNDVLAVKGYIRGHRRESASRGAA